jgi:signal transduction histidine kinase
MHSKFAFLEHIVTCPMNIKHLVLVVDDEYGPRESIAFTLSGEFLVDTAGRAAEALQKFCERQYSAVIMDIRMPEMDGVKAVAEIRKIDPHVSVIMLTGYGTLLTAQQAMIAGANQYLKKPPDVAELVGAVRQQCENAKLRRRQAQISEDAIRSSAALKQEIEKNQPRIWQARASVELVHDLNNPLTVVIGYAALLAEEARALEKERHPLSDKILEYADMVERAAEYCHHISENWRSASQKMGDFARLDILELVREVQRVIFFNSISVCFTGVNYGWIRGSRFELMRVFQNLIRNALEAGATEVQVSTIKTNRLLEVKISDNGAGMNATLMAKALRGGYSSKPTGTGLGLSICRHLLGAHGASFALESIEGKGSTARLIFPSED